MTTIDIRKGDLVKATSKYDPEVTATTRVVTRVLPSHEALYSARLDTYLGFEDYDFEVLERPIDEELLDGAAAAGGRVYNFKPGTEGETFRKAVAAVIEFVRSYDKEHSK